MNSSEMNSLLAGGVGVTLAVLAVTFLVACFCLHLGASMAGIEKRSFGKAFFGTLVGIPAELIPAVLCGLLIPIIGNVVGWFVGFLCACAVTAAIYGATFGKGFAAYTLAFILRLVVICGLGAVAISVLGLSLAELTDKFSR